MLRLFRLFSLTTVMAAGALVYTNTTVEDFKLEGKKIRENEQSAVRAGWSAVSRVTGLNAIAKVAGMGNYELCRKNLYVASLYRVKNKQLLEETYPVAVGFGAAKRVWILHSKNAPSNQSLWFSQIAGVTSALNFGECEIVHNPGEF